MKKTIIALTVLAGFAAFVPAANAGYGYGGYGNRYFNGGSRWCDDCGYRSYNYTRWDECDD
jgi:hypothetical protein